MHEFIVALKIIFCFTQNLNISVANRIKQSLCRVFIDQKENINIYVLKIKSVQITTLYMN